MRKRPIRNTQCKNCQNQLEVKDLFCSVCGQENHYVDHSVKEIWRDFISSFINFDQKVWKTFSTIIKYPGKMSVEYVAGKKVSYVPPFRLYLFLSFIFFFIFSKITQNDSVGLTSNYHSTYSIEKKIVRKMEQFDSMKDRMEFLSSQRSIQKNNPDLYNKLQTHSGHVLNYTVLDSLYDFANVRIDIDPAFDSINLLGNNNSSKYIVPIHKAQTFFEDDDKLDAFLKSQGNGIIKRYFLKKTARRKLSYYFDKKLMITELSGQIAQLISSFTWIFLFVLPFSGLLLFLFFRRRRPFFYDHLIFSIHLHCFLLLIGTALFIFSLLTFLLIRTENGFVNGFLTFLDLGILAFILTYFFRSIRTFYAITWTRTIFLGISFLAIYLIFFLIFMFSGVLFSIYL